MNLSSWLKRFSLLANRQCPISWASKRRKGSVVEKVLQSSPKQNKTSVQIDCLTFFLQSGDTCNLQITILKLQRLCTFFVKIQSGGSKNCLPLISANSSGSPKRNFKHWNNSFHEQALTVFWTIFTKRGLDCILNILSHNTQQTHSNMEHKYCYIHWLEDLGILLFVWSFFGRTRLFGNNTVGEIISCRKNKLRIERPYLIMIRKTRFFSCSSWNSQDS